MNKAGITIHITERNALQGLPLSYVLGTKYRTRFNYS